VTRAVLIKILDAGQLGIENTEVSIGDTITLGAELTDNKRPEAQVTVIPGRQVHVVGGADMARRIASHFRRVRERVENVLETQRRLHDRLLGIIESTAAGREVMPQRGNLTAIDVGQTRVQSRCAHIQIEFMRAFDLHLFNHLEESPHAARVVELYRQYHAEHTDPEPFLPGFYALLGKERAQGRLGAMPKTLGPILDMTLGAGRIATDLGPAAVTILDRAAVAADRDSAQDSLTAGERLQQQILTELLGLQRLLEEWNEFQDVIIQARSVLDKQREVQVLTRNAMNPPTHKGDGR